MRRRVRPSLPKDAIFFCLSQELHERLAAHRRLRPLQPRNDCVCLHLFERPSIGNRSTQEASLVFTVRLLRERPERYLHPHFEAIHATQGITNQNLILIIIIIKAMCTASVRSSFNNKASRLLLFSNSIVPTLSPQFLLGYGTRFKTFDES